MIGHRENRNAFTIVELLVASAITLGLVVLLGVIFGSITRTASRANQRTDAFRDARPALQMMERDFSALVRTQWQPDPFAVPPPTGSSQPTTRPSAFLALEDIYADPAAGNQQLFGLIALKNAALGDVCAVGYYCSWDGNAYSLRRYFRDSAATHAVFFSTATYVPDTALYVPDPSANASPPDDILARYVWNLKVTAYDSAGAILSYPYVCDPKSTSTGTAATPTKVPAAIEISFNAMSAEAARTIMSLSTSANDWMDPNSTNYKRLIAPNVYVFRSRIKL
jgi:type II secretory pathway pseudopilin PulG